MQSVKFVQKYVRENKNDLDEGFLRSSYILLSYALELMLKSRLVAVSNVTEKQIRNEYLHNIDTIANELKSLGELEKIGIIKAVKNKLNIPISLKLQMMKILRCMISQKLGIGRRIEKYPIKNTRFSKRQLEF